MLEVGTDSYVTTTEADEYISKKYRANSKDRKRWEESTEEDKEILLRQACAEIDLLHLRGRKVTASQALAFPRLPYQYCHTSEVAPTAVKQAQIELALWLSDDPKKEEAQKRSDIQAQGVESFTVGDLTESYSKSKIAQAALICMKCKNLLSPYLSGGFKVC